MTQHNTTQHNTKGFLSKPLIKAEIAVLVSLVFVVSCGSDKKRCENKNRRVWNSAENKCESQAEAKAVADKNKCLKSGKTWSAVRKKCSYKLQKNTAFKPSCEDGGGIIPSSSAICDINAEVTGVPACGTIPGQGKLQAYCIDQNDVVIEDQVPHCGKDNAKKPICSQLITSG